MSTATLLLLGLVVLGAGYWIYGGFLRRRLLLGPGLGGKTPAYSERDGVDYEPAPARMVFGHHFASIAGAGPIVGPILAAEFGWVPVLLWVLLGGIFVGGVHDLASLVASLRHRGLSVISLVERYIGRDAMLIFGTFAVLALILVVAVFTNVVISQFQVVGDGGTVAACSAWFLVMALIYGFVQRRWQPGAWLSTLLALGGLVAALWLGWQVPLVMDQSLPLPWSDGTGAPARASIWIPIIAIYCVAASVTPVWLLLQPRDYLSSFLLYGLLLGGVIGALISAAPIVAPAWVGFVAPQQGLLFPFLFITVACGACSGFHSIVASGTTAKQLDRERDAMPVAYGGMLTESLLAVLALASVGMLAAGAARPAGGPIAAFAAGVGGFLAEFGIPGPVAITAVALTVSTFALTSLDTCTRLARFLIQELLGTAQPEQAAQAAWWRRTLGSRWGATLLVVGAGMSLSLSGGATQLWPAFGAANQLLAALALMAVACWLGHLGRRRLMVVLPMLFMFASTLTALALLTWRYSQTETYSPILRLVCATMLLLGLTLLLRSAKRIFSPAPPATA